MREHPIQVRWLTSIALCAGALFGCTVDTSLRAEPRLRCGPGGQCLDGFVCAGDGTCRARLSVEPDVYEGIEDTRVVVPPDRGVLANDRKLVGSTLTAQLVTAPAQGVLALAADGSFTYDPAPDASGTVTFTYRANDGTTDSEVATATLTIAPAADAPRAAPDAYTTAEDAPLAVAAGQGVLANDRDPDGEPITATLEAPTTRGTVMLAADGSFLYTPTANFVGADTFTYRARAGTRASEPAMVTITVTPVNDAPVAAPDAYRTDVGTTLWVPSWIGVLVNDFDVEAAPLVAEIQTQPTGGTLALQPSGGFTYVPMASFHGVDSFAYRARDDEGSASQTVQVQLRVELPAGRPPERASVTSSGAQSTLSTPFSRVQLSGDGRFVVFDAAARLVPEDTSSTIDIYVRDRLTNTTARVNVGAGGVEADASSRDPNISEDGRFVAFASAATNLVAGDTNGVSDVFLRDRTLGVTTRLTAGVGGSQTNGASFVPVLSADGRVVVFTSAASNLVAGDTNALSDVYARDLASATTTRISVGPGSREGDGASFAPAVSADGRFVAFHSDAANLVDGDTNGVADAFVHDRAMGLTTRVSVSSSGGQGNRPTINATISADGRWVAFLSSATNLVPGDENNRSDLFVHDRMSGTTVRASELPSGASLAEGVNGGILSPDGRYALFAAHAEEIVGPTPAGTTNVFLKDLRDGRVRLLSARSDGSQGGPSDTPFAISPDSRYVAFTTRNSDIVPGDTNGPSEDLVVRPLPRQDAVALASGARAEPGNGEVASGSSLSMSFHCEQVAFVSPASNLVPGDTNTVADAFVRDLDLAQTARVSLGESDAQASLPTTAAKLSPDGRFVAFATASPLVSGDTNGASDVFLRDLQTGLVRRVSVHTGGTQGNGESRGASVGGLGACLAFLSDATNLVDGDTNGVTDAFVHFPSTGETRRISVASGGAQGNGGTSAVAVGADCTVVAFASSATNLVAADQNGFEDVFVHELATSTTTLASLATAGTQPNGSSGAPSVSADGRIVAFTSDALNLVTSPNGGRRHVFVRDRQAGTLRHVSPSRPATSATGDSDTAGLSQDGRFVAFRSRNTNLVTGDTNGVADVFVVEVATSVLARAGLGASGVEPDGAALDVTICGDGRALAIVSAATNLVPGDTNGFADAFLLANPLY